MQDSTSTTTAAALMAPAHVVFDFNDGSPALEGIMSPARAQALMALMKADTNKRTVRQSDGLHYGCGSSQPSARDMSARLLQLTDLLSSLAHVMRSARWHNQPAARLRDAFFPKDDGLGLGIGIGRTWDVISTLVWIQDAAEKLAAQGCEQTRAEVMGVIQAANRYPNMSPHTEANLAAKGHTTAEYLILMACTVAGHIAQAFEQVQGPAYQQLRKDALQARVLLTEAQAVIDAGVAYTLGLDDLH
ncbi:MULTISPECIES: hypothetical protein [unclassified Acidovorax]|uniref:hypothetical protein n=1 Tax=unclassified Acidovorax TaxID=2684926 RepID=UPI000B3FCDC6|nr:MULTISPECIES: hypothetical protein [unclassified Acidovorax]